MKKNTYTTLRHVMTQLASTVAADVPPKTSHLPENGFLLVVQCGDMYA